MNMNVSRDEVKFSVKLAVNFSFILPLEIRLFLRFLAENDENNVVHPANLTLLWILKL